ncbi:hypothetical protein IGI89_003338 [Enterococcus sp. AZ141]|uniref:GNAT family N-acetyltransferase n=1 Tax=Enterococcus sp. AZ141 TaxID=2774681 RepID=UPI003F238E07
MNLESDRMKFKEINSENKGLLKAIIQDKNLMMLGWGKTYSESEVDLWVEKIISQYGEYGTSYYFIDKKDTAENIGIVGILPTCIENKEVFEIAYIVKEEFQGNGYATEGIRELIQHFFQKQEGKEVLAQFVPENVSSEKVAKKLGMNYKFSYQRDYNDEIKEHIVYGITNQLID